MVRYPRGHKEKTREQILDAAARAFREEGVSNVGIGELMGRAGLTHGGFYAHFGSKDELVAEACRHAVEHSTYRLGDASPGAEHPGEALAAAIRVYVSRKHRDHPGEGCVLPSLGVEMARHSPQARTAFTDAFRTYLREIDTLVPGDTDEERMDAAMALGAGMVGAVMLSRAVDDPALSDRILLATRRFLTGAFTADDG